MAPMGALLSFDELEHAMRSLPLRMEPMLILVRQSRFPVEECQIPTPDRGRGSKSRHCLMLPQQRSPLHRL